MQKKVAGTARDGSQQGSRPQAASELGHLFWVLSKGYRV